MVTGLLSEEVVERDCKPVRVRLLGEELVCFRDSQGRLGVIEGSVGTEARLLRSDGMRTAGRCSITVGN